MLNINPIWTPEHQQETFRTILTAMSQPGKVLAIHHDEYSDCLSAVLATLLDGTVSLADPDLLVSAADWPMLQVNQADVDKADFIVCNGQSKLCIEPKLGSLESPEQSATLMLSVKSLTEGDLIALLSGPGVNGCTKIHCSGLDAEWLRQREDWVCEFPLGIDILLIDSQGIMALPRTTKVEVK